MIDEAYSEKDISDAKYKDKEIRLQSVNNYVIGSRGWLYQYKIEINGFAAAELNPFDKTSVFITVAKYRKYEK